MSVGSLFFAFCVVLCLVGAVSTIASHNPIRSAVGLLGTIIGIAGLFLKLAAEFLAAIQLIVYAGAVVVLFVFVIMLLGPDATLADDTPARARFSRWGGAALFVVLALGAAFGFHGGWGPPTPLPNVQPGHGSTEAVGGMLFHQGLVPFELATALLIVAAVGAIAVARSRHHVKPATQEPNASKRMFAGPIHPRDAERPLGREGAR